jgi:hypothetical protein
VKGSRRHKRKQLVMMMVVVVVVKRMKRGVRTSALRRFVVDEGIRTERA